MGVTEALVVIGLIFLLGVFPLWFLIKIMGGRVSLLRAFAIKIAAIIITILLSMAFGFWGPLLVAIFLIVLYMVAFRIGIIRAFLAWLLEGVVLAAIIFVIGALGYTAVQWDGIIHALNTLSAMV